MSKLDGRIKVEGKGTNISQLTQRTHSANTQNAKEMEKERKENPNVDEIISKTQKLKKNKRKTTYGILNLCSHILLYSFYSKTSLFISN